MDNRVELGLYTNDQINDLRLRGVQRGRNIPTIFLGLEELLEDEIQRVAVEADLPPTLQHYFAYLYSIKGMSAQDTLDYLRDVLEQPNFSSLIDLRELLKEMLIPVRDIGQSKRLQSYQNRILPDSGLSDGELAVLVCAAKGYVKSKDIANVLSISPNAVEHRKAELYDKLVRYKVKRNLQAAADYFISKEWNNHPSVIENFKHIPTKTY